MKCQLDNQISNLVQFKINLSLFMCVLFCSSFVCIPAYENFYFKTTIIKQNIKMILLQKNIHVSEVHCWSAVRFGQALPGYLITAPPSVCIPDVIGALAVWIQNQKKTCLQGVNHGLSSTWARTVTAYGDSYRCLWYARRGFWPLPVCYHSQGVYFHPNIRI